MAKYRLNGMVTNNDDADLYRWWGYNNVCCPNDVRKALEECPEGEDLVFEINSGGGSVYAGFEMYSLLRNSGRKVTAEIQSIAGSAMSVIVSACGKVLMSPVANIMIHRSSVRYSEGNAEQLKQDAQMLDTIDESILNAYVGKVAGKTSRTTLRYMMENETFLTPEEAIDCGLADGILEISEDLNGPNPMSAVACMAMANLPPADDLRRIRAEREGSNSRSKVTAVEKNIRNTEEEHTMEYENKEQLAEAFPEMIREIREEAQAEERNRISEIDAVAIPGFEELVTAAKADPTQTAGDVARAILGKQKEMGTNFARGLVADAKGSGANDVLSAPELQEAGNTEEETKAAAKNAVAEWKERRKK